VTDHLSRYDVFMGGEDENSVNRCNRSLLLNTMGPEKSNEFLRGVPDPRLAVAVARGYRFEEFVTEIL